LFYLFIGSVLDRRGQKFRTFSSKFTCSCVLQFIEHDMTIVEGVTSYFYGFGSLLVRAFDLRLNGHEFNRRPAHYQSTGTGMGDRLRAGMPPWYTASHPGRLSLLPSVGRKMSTGQIAVMRCGWGLKAGRFIPFRSWISVWVAGKTVWSLVNACDLKTNILVTRCYTNVLPNQARSGYMKVKVGTGAFAPGGTLQASIFRTQKFTWSQELWSLPLSSSTVFDLTEHVCKIISR